jgi:release factor glutamine methyltransferase
MGWAVEKHTVATILSQGAARLQACSDAPRLEAELLLAHALGRSRTALHTHPEHRPSQDELSAFLGLLDRRGDGVPLPYLTGRAEFFGLDFAIDPRVLIPRPETETLVELALSLVCAHSSLTLADVGTGSGCIAVALAVHAPQAHVYALDLSPVALDVARANARRCQAAERITFLHSDLCAALPEPVDLIVSNPPYVAAAEWPALPREVREHEPRLALDGGSDGLNVARRLLGQAAAYLNPGGAVLVEIGASQGLAALELARARYPAADLALHPDLAGRDRVLCVRTRTEGGRHAPG